MLLAKNKLNTTEALISKALIGSFINYDECVSMNNVIREYNEMKKDIKNSENAVKYTI